MNQNKLREILRRRGLDQADVARLIAVPPTTLASWMNERHPAPPDLADRIETALALQPGILTDAQAVVVAVPLATSLADDELHDRACAIYKNGCLLYDFTYEQPTRSETRIEHYPDSRRVLVLGNTALDCELIWFNINPNGGLERTDVKPGQS